MTSRAKGQRARHEDMPDLPDGARLAGYWHSSCDHCARGYVGAQNARFCSESCKVGAHRARKEK